MQKEYKIQKVYFWHKITNKEKALFYEHLSNLVDGGVTVTQSIHSFLEKTINPKLAQEIYNLLIFIESGDSFSTAMKKMPFVFDKREVAIIEAGENSGTIQRSFSVLGRQLREQEELKAKVIGAMTYPIIILVFLVIAISVIMIYVIPKVKPLFENAEVALPFATQTLVSTSDFVINNFISIIFVILVIIFMLKIYISTDTGKKFVDKFALELPLVGDVYKNYIISQISANLSILIGSGIPIIKTLYLTGEATNNFLYIDAIEMVAKDIEKGYKMTESIEKVDPEHRFFTSDFIQMMGAGEKTSTVNKVCDKLFVQYTREVNNSIAVLVKWIEPMAILIAGLFVLWFAFAIFSAVLKMTETVAA